MKVIRHKTVHAVFPKFNTPEREKQTSSEKSRSIIKWDQSELYTDEGMLWGFGRYYISCGVVITWMAIFFKISQNSQLKWMHFIVYNLYLNKTDLKSKENEQNI